MTNKFYITTNKSKIDIDFIHSYLSEKAYWAKGRSKEDVIKTIKNSLCFSVFSNSNDQVGFARVATDYVVFAWLMDVFIDKKHQNKGLAQMLMDYIMNHPDLKNVNGIGLKTKDAHGLYEKFGFEKIGDPEIWMFKKN